MKEPEKCGNMSDVRAAIDTIDKEIVRNIALRAKYVSAAAAFKKSADAVRDRERVAQVIESKKQLAKEFGAPQDLIAQVYTTMIDFFVDQEMKEWQKHDRGVIHG